MTQSTVNLTRIEPERRPAKKKSTSRLSKGIKEFILMNDPIGYADKMISKLVQNYYLTTIEKHTRDGKL